MAIRTERRIPVNRGCYGVLHHFKKYSVISWRQLYLWRKPEYPKKTTDLSQVTDKLNNVMLYRVHLPRTGFEHTMFVVIGTACIGSYELLCDHDYDGFMELYIYVLNYHLL
jgi:hypothetical protein